MSLISRRLGEKQRSRRRERFLKEKAYLHLDTTYLKVRWGVRDTSMTLLACVGLDEDGFRGSSGDGDRWNTRRRRSSLPGSRDLATRR